MGYNSRPPLEPIDESLQHILRDTPMEQRPALADAFLAKAAKRMMELRGELTARARKTLGIIGTEAEEHTDDLIEKAFLRLRKQFGLPQSEWVHKNRYGEMVLGWYWEAGVSMRTWLFSFQGSPFSRRRSGLLTNHARKLRRRMHGSIHDDGFDAEDTNLVSPEASAYVEGVLRKLPPRDLFILAAFTGAHPYETLDSQTLIALACTLKLSPREIEQIEEAASRLISTEGRKTLTAEEIASLLDLSPRRVRQIVERIEAQMRGKDA